MSMEWHRAQLLKGEVLASLLRRRQRYRWSDRENSKEKGVQVQFHLTVSVLGFRYPHIPV